MSIHRISYEDQLVIRIIFGIDHLNEIKDSGFRGLLCYQTDIRNCNEMPIFNLHIRYTTITP